MLIIKQFNVNAETRITCAFERNFTTEKPSEILEILRRDLSFGTDAELSVGNYDILRSLFHQKIPNRSVIPLLTSSRMNCNLTEEAKYADSIDQLLSTQNLPQYQNDQNASIMQKQMKDNDTALSAVTSLLYDIKNSIVNQNENTARLSEQLVNKTFK